MTDGPSPSIDLGNGVRMPALGLGVFLSPPEQTAAAVEAAIACGYRLVDTAAAYNNERQVGEGIRRSGIDRTEMFVTTKLWMTNYGYEATLRAFDASLGRLGLDYLDLYLLHWPMPSDFAATVASYRAAERLLAEGRVRAIGVSNFSPQHLETLIAQTDVVPAVNQVELHPYFTQQEVRDADTRYGLVTHRRRALPQPGGRAHSGEGPARRADSRRACLQARQDAGPGRPALAHPARPLCHPQVGEGAAHRREHRDLRLHPGAR